VEDFLKEVEDEIKKMAASDAPKVKVKIESNQSTNQ
jgi:hypothetical protein